MKNTKGMIAKRPNFSVAIKYSDKAIKENLIKFIPNGNKPFEVSIQDLVNMLARHVNSEVLAPAIMQNKVIRMIKVKRNLNFTPNKDIKAGELVHIPFHQMMPIEFAIAEEALGLALIDDNIKKINEKEFIQAGKRVSESIEEFSREQNEALLRQLNNQTEPTKVEIDQAET